MTFLALDLGTSVGYAIDRGDAPPFLGTHSLSKLSGFGARFNNYQRWLAEKITLYKPALVCFESPLPPQRQMSGHAARIAYGLAGYTEGVCWDLGVRCVEVENHTHKQAFCGSGNAKKERIMAECQRRGWEPPNQDAADAGSVLSYLMKVYNGIDRYQHAA